MLKCTFTAYSARFGLKTVGNILDRMSELRVMAQDITKNAGDIENYSKVLGTPSQLIRSAGKPLMGLVFAKLTLQELLAELSAMEENLILHLVIQLHLNINPHNNSDAYTSRDGTAVRYDKYGRTFYSHVWSGFDGSISLNVVNLQFVLSIGTLDVNQT